MMDMPEFWGWLPHLNPSLEIEFPEEFMRRYLSKWKGATLYSTDVGSARGKEYHPKISLVDDFSYSQKFPVSVEYTADEKVIKQIVLITIYPDGFISFNPVDWMIGDIKSHDCGNYNKALKNMLRALYYFFRHILGCKLITAFDNPMDNSLEVYHSDDTLTITENETCSKKEAFEDVIRTLVQLCEDNSSITSRTYDSPDSKSNFSQLAQQYDILCECSLWGRNLVDIALGEKLIDKKYHDSLTRTFELYSEIPAYVVPRLSLMKNAEQNYEAIEQNYLNIEQNNRTIEQNDKSIVLSKHSIIVALAAIVISFLAGSIFNECVTGDVNQPTFILMIVIMAIISILFVVGAIVLRPKEKYKVSKSQ